MSDDRTRSIRISLTEDEYQRMGRAARRRGFSRRSEWGRVVLVREVDTETWAIEGAEDTPVPDDEDTQSEQGDEPRAVATWPPQESAVTVHLSAHFTLAEMTHTSKPFLNEPDAEAIECLRRLCHELEAWRVVAGPLEVTSGYRSPQVNAAVGGSRTSQHLRGEAADVIPVHGRGPAWDHLVRLIIAGLPIDQAIIYEGLPHIHVSHTLRYPPRRELLVCLRDGRYTPWGSYAGTLRGAG